MKTFPLFVSLAGRAVAIVGGGEQAAQKARLLLKTNAELRLIAPALDAELAGLVVSGRARHHAAEADAAALSGARLVFIATGCAGADAAIADLAKGAGALVNVVDRPELCDVLTPAIVDRDPVVVAIGTEGAAPVLARQIKTRVEAMLEPRLGAFAALAGRLRDAVARRVERPRRRPFWRWVFTEAPRRLFAAGREREAAQLIKSAIAQGGAPAEAETVAAQGGPAPGPFAAPESLPEGATRGLVSLVGAGPGAPDLLTLRGVQRLQEADVIFYDRLVDPSLLELARRDAERVFVGKDHGAALAWPQERINGVVVAAAREGKRVVRLKSGDPLVFGRAAEEAQAAEAAGVAWEVVPGVTAAFAAAAEARLFPTERGASRHLILATGQAAAGAPPPDVAALARPGGTLAVYMGVGAAESIERGLLARGAPADAPATVVEKAATAEARVLAAPLSELAALVRREGVASPAMLFVRWPADEESAGRRAAG